ncbi:MAG: hypothetical protein AAFX05_09980 [Planctomycetota bacterium]
MQTDVHVSERRSMFLGAAIAIAGIIAGAMLFGPRTDVANAAEPQFIPGCSNLPATVIGVNETVLMSGPSGIAFIVDSRGGTIPVRYRDTDLRSIPGQSFLTFSRP